jgi:antitoxin HigA-1
MPQFNPPHPGGTLRDDILPALSLTVTQASEQLGVTRAALSRVLNGHAAVSPNMALRLESWLGIANGGSASAWMAQQAAHDLWQTRQKGLPKIGFSWADSPIFAHQTSNNNTAFARDTKNTMNF